MRTPFAILLVVVLLAIGVCVSLALWRLWVDVERAHVDIARHEAALSASCVALISRTGEAYGEDAVSADWQQAQHHHLLFNPATGTCSLGSDHW